MPTWYKEYRNMYCVTNVATRIAMLLKRSLSSKLCMRRAFHVNKSFFPDVAGLSNSEGSGRRVNIFLHLFSSCVPLCVFSPSPEASMRTPYTHPPLPSPLLPSFH